MMEVLIVIHGMGCGGAEKSLISLLSYLQSENMNIDLIVANPHGPLITKVPSAVHIIENMYDFENFATPLNERTKKISGFRDFILQTKWHLLAPAARKKSSLSEGELRWKIWGKYLKPLKKQYDLAISYMNGYPNYYVIEKVRAKKKILWIHNEFEKLGYNYNFERKYYSLADAIVTISESCRESFLHIFPEMTEKIYVLENISSEKTIRVLSEERIKDSYFECSDIKVLSVGRLTDQKGFDLAIDAASMLKHKGYTFKWYILGEGELRGKLQHSINAYGLDDRVVLAGIKENPYPYIKNCDIFVQPSRYEGKSIVLDEAKILCRPIVVTNYKTVKSSIKDRVNGIITEIRSEDIAEKIGNLIDDASKRQYLIDTLAHEENGNEREVDKYISLFRRMMKE